MNVSEPLMTPRQSETRVMGCGAGVKNWPLRKRQAATGGMAGRENIATPNITAAVGEPPSSQFMSRASIGSASWSLRIMGAPALITCE